MIITALCCDKTRPSSRVEEEDSGGLVRGWGMNQVCSLTSQSPYQFEFILKVF